MASFRNKQNLSSILGLSLDGSRFEGVVVRRTNGSVVIQKSFSVLLSLDPLANDPELVGQEIRNHLDKAGIRERHCAVCVPLSWALTLQTKLPEIAEEDLPSFLQIEAERGFPYSPEALLISSSRLASPSGERYATQIAVPRDHVSRLEKSLQAARLKPLTFSLGIAASEGPLRNLSQGLLMLAIGENGVALQATCGGGIAALRSLEGTIETESGRKEVYPEAVAREIRITLGQLPNDLRGAVKRIRVLGTGELPQQLAAELRSRSSSLGAQAEAVTGYPAEEFGVQVPAEAGFSGALSLAVRYLARRGTGLEFLPPKVSSWQQFTTRYSSRKLVTAGAAACVLLLLIGGAFGYQQWELSGLTSKWAAMSPKVAELEELQQQIRRFRPWFDDSFRNLVILRKVTEAFPEEGDVTAKSVEIRDLSSITCSGVARDNSSFLKMLDQLRATKEFADLKVDNVRGKEPLQFSVNFRWEAGGVNEH